MLSAKLIAAAMVATYSIPVYSLPAALAAEVNQGSATTRSSTDNPSTISLPTLTIPRSVVPAAATQAEKDPLTQHGAVNRSAEVLSPPSVVAPESKEPFQDKEPRLILALSGGGCKAVAEIGVLRSFEQHGIKIDGIVGTSMGSTVGALYCAGVSVDDIEKIFLDGTLQNALLKGAAVSIITRPIKPLFYLFKGRPYSGITSGDGYLKLLQEKLPADFNKLKIPFAAVVTNLTDGETVVLAKGDLPRSVLASNCVPTLYRPIMIDNKLYVDGGLKANLPSNIAQSMGADIVVAALCDTAVKPVPNKQFKSKKQLIMRVMDIMLANADKQQAHASDILIYPDVDFVPGLTKDKEILKRGIANGQKAADTVATKVKAELLALDKSQGRREVVEIPSKQEAISPEIVK